MIKAFLKYTLTLIGTLSAATFVFGFYLLFTTQGSQLLISIISEVSPYRIQYHKFDGYLARKLQFEDLELTGPHLKVHARTLHARWTLVDLLRATKTVQSLSAEDFSLHYQGKKIDPNTPQVLLPFPFVIEDLTLKKALFSINDDHHAVTYLQLKRAVTTDLSALKEIHYEGSLGKLDAILNQAIDAKWELHFEDAPFLRGYLQGKVKSQGEVWLPKRKWRDPNNTIHIILSAEQANLERYIVKADDFSARRQTNEAPDMHILVPEGVSECSQQRRKFICEDYTIQNINLNLKGTLANHHASLTGLFHKTPFVLDLKGKLSPTTWHAHIKELWFDQTIKEALGSSTGTFTLGWEKKSVRATLDLLLGGKQPLHADVHIRKNVSRTVKGHLHAEVKKLKSLALFVPELRRLRGSAELNLRLSGSLNNILYSGDIVFNDLRMTTPFLKSKAIIQRLTLSLQEKNALTLKGQGTLDKGVFYIEGAGKFNVKNPYLKMHVKGEQLLLSDTPEYYIVANPDLTFTLQPTGPTLEGSIFIPHAEIRSLKNPHARSSSDDVVIVSNKKAAPVNVPHYSLAHQLSTNIHIVLGDKISYEGYGIKTKAQGQLNIKQSPGQPTKAKGKITLVKGSYRAYGKRFDLSEGELLFTGNVIDNPTLNIRAERKIKVNPSVKSFHAHNTVKAGVRFIGPLKNSRIEFYSSPMMSNADIISYLVIGQPQSQMNESQAALLFEALSQLTIFSGNKRSDVQLSLAEQLKLDQFGFSKKEGSFSKGASSGLEDTVFVLGKQLSDKLYLHYSVGLMDASNNIGIRYFMGKNITLEASTGTESTSADLLLTFES